MGGGRRLNSGDGQALICRESKVKEMCAGKGKGLKKLTAGGQWVSQVDGGETVGRKVNRKNELMEGSGEDRRGLHFLRGKGCGALDRLNNTESSSLCEGSWSQSGQVNPPTLEPRVRLAAKISDEARGGEDGGCESAARAPAGQPLGTSANRSHRRAETSQSVSRGLTWEQLFSVVGAAPYGGAERTGGRGFSCQHHPGQTSQKKRLRRSGCRRRWLRHLR